MLRRSAQQRRCPRLRRVHRTRRARAPPPRHGTPPAALQRVRGGWSMQQKVLQATLAAGAPCASAYGRTAWAPPGPRSARPRNPPAHTPAPAAAREHGCTTLTTCTQAAHTLRAHRALAVHRVAVTVQSSGDASALQGEHSAADRVRPGACATHPVSPSPMTGRRVAAQMRRPASAISPYDIRPASGAPSCAALTQKPLCRKQRERALSAGCGGQAVASRSASAP